MESDSYRPAALEGGRSFEREYRHRDRSRSPRRRSPDHRDRASRSRSRDEYRRRSSRSPMSGSGGHQGGYSGSGYQGSSGGAGGPRRSYEERAAAKDAMMQSLRDSSQQDRRVYVGNLSYDVKWHHLKDFMRQAGEVLFADVLLLPNGMSKVGTTVKDTGDQAQTAVNTLSNQNLMGRLVYVREDREAEPRFTGQQGTRPPYAGGPPGAGYPGGGYSGGGGGGVPGAGGRQIYVSNLPYTVGWQDLKDLFRQAGSVVRADVHIGPDGRPKGSGVVAFESPEDARNAIAQFNNYDWQGRQLEVREDRFAGSSGFVTMPPCRLTSSRITLLAEESAVRQFTSAIFHGPPATMTWSSCLIQLERSNVPRFSMSLMEDPGEPNAETAISKFTGYLYGGRPLGLSYVKYSNFGSNGADAMEGTEPTLTQDQMM
ncbi:hypothetical protein C7212DRAFT_290400 [Tuber magnatum]|uniref:RRM domain-containing protein n=1 Tax=Tuber magnatum TaxID=42249 RepID=A0A317T1Q1_9PEZI|nr:hypothetical protein C7212DRAFT_290400 [Tuber magnatum]